MRYGEQIVSAAAKVAALGRKATDEDVRADAGLYPAVVSWLRERPPSDFAFIESLRRQERPLSDRQTAAALNCLVAEQRQHPDRFATQPELPPVEIAPAVKPGYYTVILNGNDYVTVRLTDRTEWAADLAPGTLVASFLAGPDNGSDYCGCAFVVGRTVRLWKRFRTDGRLAEALSRLLDGSADEAGRRYARQSGSCYRCGRLLTTPESIERGIGPVCVTR